jgi:hypothetical protein
MFYIKDWELYDSSPDSKHLVEHHRCRCNFEPFSRLTAGDPSDLAPPGAGQPLPPVGVVAVGPGVQTGSQVVHLKVANALVNASNVADIGLLVVRPAGTCLGSLHVFLMRVSVCDRILKSWYASLSVGELNGPLPVSSRRMCEGLARAPCVDIQRLQWACPTVAVFHSTP